MVVCSIPGAGRVFCLPAPVAFAFDLSADRLFRFTPGAITAPGDFALVQAADGAICFALVGPCEYHTAMRDLPRNSAQLLGVAVLMPGYPHRL